MNQVSVELSFSNPILAINTLRRFDSAHLSLRELAQFSVNPESILIYLKKMLMFNIASP